MTTAREIMTPDATYCPEDATAADAARRWPTKDIGALPVCNADGRLAGVVTDRDLAVKVVAEGRDPDDHASRLPRRDRGRHDRRR